MRRSVVVGRVHPETHRQQATEQHDGVDVAEQRASSQFLLDRVEDGPLADVRLSGFVL